MIALSNLNALARTPGGLARAAKIIGCERAAVEAVIKVETGSRPRGFDSKGRLIALFEPHIFHRLLCPAPDKLNQAVAAGVACPVWRRDYPKDSYPRIKAACEIDEELALRAVSWGLPQILGSNFKAAGYQDARQMVAAFLMGEDEQFAAMARFIVSNGLAVALMSKDWASFARGYNGPGYAKNAYDRKLAVAYQKALASPMTFPKVGPKRAGQAEAGGAAGVGAAAIVFAIYFPDIPWWCWILAATGVVFLISFVAGRVGKPAGGIGKVVAGLRSQREQFLAMTQKAEARVSAEGGEIIKQQQALATAKAAITDLGLNPVAVAVEPKK